MNGEKRRQAAFNVFGMELLAAMDTATLNMFFNTFFRLPAYFWRGFLSNKLSSELECVGLVMPATTPPPGSCSRWLLGRRTALASSWELRPAPQGAKTWKGKEHQP